MLAGGQAAPQASVPPLRCQGGQELHRRTWTCRGQAAWEGALGAQHGRDICPQGGGASLPRGWGLSDTEPDRDITPLPPCVRVCVHVFIYCRDVFSWGVGGFVNICDHVCVSTHQVRARMCVSGVHAFPLRRGAYVRDRGWRVTNEDGCHRPESTDLGVTLPTEYGPRPQHPQGPGRGSCPPPPTPGGWNEGPLWNCTSTSPPPPRRLRRGEPSPALSQV